MATGGESIGFGLGVVGRCWCFGKIKFKHFRIFDVGFRCVFFLKKKMGRLSIKLYRKD